MPTVPLPRLTDPRWLPRLLLFVAMVVACVSARPYAGGWNDGSRLASVESLVDRHTFAIDNSVFIRVPPALIELGTTPYPPNQPHLLKTGSLDKLLIDGHFYSDKPPVVSVLMAGEYQLWRWLGLPSFAERPDVVCYFLTLGTSGLAFVLMVWSYYQIGLLLRLPLRTRMILLAGFSICTMAPAYTRYVNNHILFLAVFAMILWQALLLREDPRQLKRLILLGILGGLGYNLDLGLAPFLAAGLFGLVVYRCRQWRPIAAFVLAALPWVVAHHVLNHAIGGSWIKPANANPQYFDWPGCPFSSNNMTGVFRHDAWGFVKYSLDLLFGKKGLLSHNLPLFFAVAASFVLGRAKQLDAEGYFALFFIIGGWLSYAALSNNLGGACASVRWFAPFVAGGYYFTAQFLSRHPASLRSIATLSAFGLPIAGLMWWYGPWMLHMVPGLWFFLAAGLMAWGYREYTQRKIVLNDPADEIRSQAA